jgi:hypothetical protein
MEREESDASGSPGAGEWLNPGKVEKQEKHLVRNTNTTPVFSAKSAQERQERRIFG